jgi:hypothetical protein
VGNGGQCRMVFQRFGQGNQFGPVSGLL